MVARNWTLLFGICLLALLGEVLGNGRLLVPPQRSSLWRDPAFQRNRKVFKNYDDHTLNCGGFWKMHENDGKCGVCGDAWDDEEPRANEAGGMYARGIIGRTYSTDKRFIDTLVQITSSISGYFEFNICPNDDVKTRVSHECLEQFPLRILSKDRSISYGRRYFPDITAGMAGIVELSLEIPDGLECTQCVLQWRWHGANNYGVCRNGRWGKGCGEQPEMYNCADIAILSESEFDKKDDRKEVKKDDKQDKRPAVTTTTAKTTTRMAKTTLKEFPSTVAITSTMEPSQKETTHTVLETTTSDSPTPEPEAETTDQNTQTTVQSDTLTTATVSQTTAQTEGVVNSTVGQSTTETSRSTTSSVDTRETSTRVLIQQTTTETIESSPVLTTIKMESSTLTPLTKAIVTENLTTLSLNGDSKVTEEQTSVEPLQTSTRSLAHQTSTSSIAELTSTEVTKSPDVTTIKMDFSTEAKANITLPLTTESVVITSANSETTVAGTTTLQQEDSTKPTGIQTSVTVTDIPTNPTTQTAPSSTTSPITETTVASETAGETEKSTVLTELKTTTESKQITESSMTVGTTETRLTTDGLSNASTEQEKTQVTTNTPSKMNQSTTVELHLFTVAPENSATTQTKPSINANISISTVTATNTDHAASSDNSTPNIVPIEKLEISTTQSVVNQTSSSDNPSSETPLIKVAISSVGSTEMPTTQSTTTVSQDATISPLVRGSIITSTGTPTASKSDISLVDLLNELSKLENVSSNELIDAISTAVNDNNSNINVNRSNPLTVINVTSSTDNVATTGSTTFSATNDTNKSPITTQTPEIDNFSTATTTMMTGLPTVALDSANIVTARTTRVVQPQGGRFGGGINVAKIVPVDQILNIDLNIPGGDAHIEKTRIDEGL